MARAIVKARQRGRSKMSTQGNTTSPYYTPWPVKETGKRRSHNKLGVTVGVTQH